MLRLTAANLETAACRSRQIGVCVPTHLTDLTNGQDRSGATNKCIARVAARAWESGEVPKTFEFLFYSQQKRLKQGRSRPEATGGWRNAVLKNKIYRALFVSAP